MRVLVTGGAGYIGSVVTEELRAQNQEVVVYDNLSRGHKNAVPTDVPFVEADLLDQAKLRETLLHFKIEAVVHMAASSLVGESMIHPRAYYENNVIATLILLNQMKDCNVGRIVFSSTAAVYGEPKKQPIEESDPTRPTNPYGETKLAAERAMYWYHNAYGIRYATLRYFNAAGASERCGELHDPESHLIPIVLQTAAGLRPFVEIFGDDYPTRDGTCVRDYIHVVDLARAHVLALKHMDSRSDFIFNLGCGRNGYTVHEVINVARKVTEKEILTKIIPRRIGDPPVLIASSEKIKRDLGWQPGKQDLEEIIGSAWRWFLRSH